MDFKVVHHPCLGFLAHDSLGFATPARVFEILGLPFSATGSRRFSRDTVVGPFGGHFEMLFAIGGFHFVTASGAWRFSGESRLALNVLNVGIGGIVLVRLTASRLTSPKAWQEITAHRTIFAKRAAQRGDARIAPL